MSGTVPTMVFRSLLAAAAAGVLLAIAGAAWLPGLACVMVAIIALLPASDGARWGSCFAILAIESALVALRLAAAPGAQIPLTDLVLWSLFRDLPVLLPALILAGCWGTRPWARWTAGSLMALHVVTSAVSAQVFTVFGQPLTWGLVMETVTDAGVCEMLGWRAILGTGTGLAAGFVFAWAIARGPRLSAWAGRMPLLALILLASSSIVHEVWCRKRLVSSVESQLAVERLSSPVWSSWRAWRDAAPPAAPWSAPRADALASWRGSPWTAPPQPAYAPLIGRYRGSNILILMMESFRAEGIGSCGGVAGDTPHFDALAREGILFDAAVDDGIYTGGALWTTLTGLPSDIPRHPLAPRQLRPGLRIPAWIATDHAGSLWCSADPGFDSMGVFASLLGWEYHQLIGPGAQGVFGLHDRHALPLAAQTLSTRPQPWSALVLSVSNHWPWEHPAADHAHPFRGGMRYSDAALGDFLTTFRASPAAAHTVLVVTADTGAWPELPTPAASGDNAIQPARHRIPILVVLPDRAGAGIVDHTLTSHADIGPLLADLCALPPPVCSLGASPLRSVSGRFAITATPETRPPGFLVWEEDSSGVVLVQSGRAQRLAPTLRHANQDWWITGAPIDEPAPRYQDLYCAVRSLLSTPDRRWRTPAGN